MKRCALPALILLTALSGCGKFFDKFSRLPGGFTKVVFNHESQNSRMIGFSAPGAIHANSVLGGGAIIYAHNVLANRTYSGTVATEGGTLALTLPNGDYSFSAFGWPTANLTDTTSIGVRCGTSAGLTLNGGAKDVTFDLSQPAACAASSSFAPSQAFNGGGALLPIQLALCNHAASLGAKTAGGSCTGADSSSAFYAGVNGQTKIDKVTYFSSSDTFFFTATHDKSTATVPFELFRFDRATGRQTKIALSLGSGSGVVSMEQAGTKNKLIFSTRDASNVGQLWAYELSDGSVTLLSQTPVVGSLGVREFRIDDGGSHVVFVGDMDIVGRNELYSVAIPADGSLAYPNPPPKISGSLTGTGVQSCASCGDHQFYFEVSPGVTAPYVAFAGLVGSLDQLHFASLDGASIPGASVNGAAVTTVLSGVAISGSEIASTPDYADIIDFSPNGQQILYHAHSSSVEKGMVISVNYSPGTSLTTTVPFPVVPSNLTHPYFVTGNTTSKAVFFLGTAANGGNTLTTVAAADLAAPTLIKLFDESGATLEVSGYELTQDDTTLVVAFSDYTGSPVTTARDIRSVPTTANTDYNGMGAGVANSYSYTSGLTPAGQFVQPLKGSGGNGNFFRMSPADTSLIFIGDLSITGLYQLWSAGLGGPPVASGGTSVTAASPVLSAGYGSDQQIYFTADLNSDGVNELYRSIPGAEPVNLQSPASVGSIFKIAEVNDLGLPNVVAMEANSLTSPGATQAFLYDIVAGTYSPVGRLGVKGAVNGVGRVKISMLQSADGYNFGTAFESACLNVAGPVIDGANLATNVLLPMGPAGGPSPFATLIEVYPLANNCNGPSDRHLFPNGIGVVKGAATGSANLQVDGSQSTLFLQDN